MHHWLFERQPIKPVQYKDLDKNTTIGEAYFQLTTFRVFQKLRKIKNKVKHH